MQGDKFLSGKEAMDAFKASGEVDMPKFVKTEQKAHMRHFTSDDAKNIIDNGVKYIQGFSVYETKKVEHSPKEVVDNPLEEKVSCMVSQYLDTLIMQHKVVLYTKTSQETFTRSRKTKARNTAMGVRPGLPDFVIVYPHCLLFLELKRLKGGRLSDLQKQWLEALNIKQMYSDDIVMVDGGWYGGRQYRKVVFSSVAYGWEEAKARIDEVQAGISNHIVIV